MLDVELPTNSDISAPPCLRVSLTPGGNGEAEMLMKIKGQLGVPLTVSPRVFIVFSRDSWGF